MISEKLRGSTLRITLFSLIIGLLQGAVFTQPVNSAANLVTITVNSSSNTPLSGASVAIGWEDLTAGKDIETVLSDVAGGVIAVVGAVKQI